MNNDFWSLLMTDIFEPNCTVRIKGRHYYTDRFLYTNPYGLTFFEAGVETGFENPYVSEKCRNTGGIIDNLYEDDLAPKPKHRDRQTISQIGITNVINKKYILKNKKENDDGTCSFDSSFTGNLFPWKDGYCLRYGVTLPSVLYFGKDLMTAKFAFCPFAEGITFEKGSRIHQTINYPLPRDEYTPPAEDEEMAIDFVSITRKLDINTAEERFRIMLDYSIEVGAALVENSSLSIVISPIDGERHP